MLQTDSGAKELTLKLAVCSNALEDPWEEPKESMFTRSVSPEKAPDKATYIEMDFEKVPPLMDACSTSLT